MLDHHPGRPADPVRHRRLAAVGREGPGAGPAGHQPQHHRAASQRGGDPPRQGDRGRSHAHEVGLPREHEPRDPHADERDHRPVAPRAQDGPHRAPARLHRQGADLRPAPAGSHQRHPRFLQGRGRQAGPGARRFRTREAAGQHRQPDQREEPRQGAGTGVRGRAGRARQPGGRFAAAGPDPAELRQQRGEVHGQGRDRDLRARERAHRDGRVAALPGPGHRASA